MKPIFNIEKRLSAPPSGRFAAAAIVLIAATGCTGAPEPETLTIYCGRGESLVGPVVEAFQAETGIQVEIRYGGTADLAAQILEEGDQSPADVYYGQDAGALGQLASEGRLSPLPDSILDRVPARFRDPAGRWVGTTGRARVFVYNTELLTPDDLPDTIQGFTDPRWRGRIGWAPTNGSFQAFVTAVRLLEGEEAARAWLEGVLANEPVAYPNNSAIYQAVADGEVELALSNHYYLFRFLVQHGDEFAARTVSPGGGGAGGLINGGRIEEETEFELVVVGDGTERTVTDVRGSVMAQGRAPHTVMFDEAGEWLYYTEFALGNVTANPGLSADTLVLRRVRPDGTGKATLYRFPHAERAVLSPDRRWIAFREYQRSFVTPFEWIGKPVTISAYDGLGFTRRVDPSDGASMAWSDAGTVSWPRGGMLHEKALDDILAGIEGAQTTDITVRFEVALPSTTVALTNARVITMDEERSVLESATILVRRHRIAEVGPNVVVPEEARVFDLAGHTVIPGLVDAHAHSVGQLATTQLIEQRLPGVTGSLAHGVTTLYELYGSEEKEPWVSDMIRSGRMDGPRMLSVGAPMYGIREYRPRTYRPIASYDDADEHASFSRDMGITALKDYVNFTRADRHQLITAARERGLNVLSETAAIPQMNFTQIVDGVTGLEHTMGLTPLYDDVIELFRASGTGVTPTLLVVYNGPVGQAYFDQSQRYWEDEKLLRFSTEERLRGRFRRVTHYWDDDLYSPEMVAAMKRLFDAGVLINAGGHGQMPGRDMHWEMELFVQGGFSEMDALQTATRNAAVYHGLGADLGSIEAGKLADLVVLGANPLDDIRNSQAVVYVVKNGVVYSGEDAARVYPGPIEAPAMYFQRER